MANHPRNEALIRRYYDAINARDFDGVWDCFAPNVVYTDAALGHVYNGLEPFKVFYLEYMMALDVRMELGQIVATDDAYGVSNHYAGVHGRDLPGMPATGRSFRVPSSAIGRIRHGKITVNTDYWNVQDLLVQLGLVGG